MEQPEEIKTFETVFVDELERKKTLRAIIGELIPQSPLPAIRFLCYWFKSVAKLHPPVLTQSPPRMPMQKSIADELYSDIQKPKAEFGQTSSTNFEQSHSLDGGEEEWCEDESSWNGSDIKSDPSSDLDREWQRRKNQFHAIGYRDGLIAGKEASAQIGFNVGFKESVIVGYNWGLVRGVTGALDCVPVELREKVIESQETSTKFHALYESVNKLSTEDALKVFADDLSKRRITRGGKEGWILPGEEHKLEGSVLHSYYGQLQSLIVESPIDVQLQGKTIHVSSTSQDPSLQ